jgi:hypothetical protein
MTGEYSHGYLPFWIVNEASTHIIVLHGITIKKNATNLIQFFGTQIQALLTLIGL